MNVTDEQLNTLREYFVGEPAVRLAFVFGSQASGRGVEESDFDIAVSLADRSHENRIWRKLSRRLGKEVDLIRLEDAPATLVSSVLKNGIPLVIRDRRLYWQLYLERTGEAEDFAEFARSYQAISARAMSLTPEDAARLIERVRFLEAEMAELGDFRSVTLPEYRDDKRTRRNMERWAENIINALIDIAKIVLASERKPMPRTYQNALESFGVLAGLPAEKAARLSEFGRLRNLLAHEYLDVLFERIGEFIEQFPCLYGGISSFLGEYVSRTRP